jgi:hypothetical protein
MHHAWQLVSVVEEWTDGRQGRPGKNSVGFDVVQALVVDE